MSGISYERLTYIQFRSGSHKVEQSINLKLVGNKAKGRISERVFQESKARQNFRKTNISYPLIRTRTCAYQGVRNVCFSEILACFAFLKHPFLDSPFCIITDELCFKSPRCRADEVHIVFHHS